MLARAGESPAPPEPPTHIVRSRGGDSHENYPWWGRSPLRFCPRRFLAHPSFTTCRALPTASASGGTASVIPEPAAVYASSPISTGATSVELLPMNAPLPMIVRCFSKDRESTRLNSSHLGISYAVF